MSQKSNHNSKRRPPSDNTEKGQQDADWGFDPDEADPAVEKKLAVALVVCLLAGFGFVFYQKFRLLRNDVTQQAGVEEQTERVDEGASGSADAEAEVATLASDDVMPGASRAEKSPSTSEQIESPFYQRDEANQSPVEADDGWTLTQAEVAPPSVMEVQAPDSPPPDTGSTDGFDPFASAGEGVPPEPSAAEDAPLPATPPSDEPPMLDWDDPTADAAPPQSEPEPALDAQSATETESVTESVPGPDPLPEISPQTSRNNHDARSDLFILEADSDDPRTAAPSDTGSQPIAEPQMLIVDNTHEAPQQSDREAETMSIEPLPGQSEPQSFEAPEVHEIDSPPTDGSDFDPFAGKPAGIDSAASAAGDTSSASRPVPSGSRTSTPEGPEMDDPLPSTNPTFPGPTGSEQTEPPLNTASDRKHNPRSTGDPFSFDAPTPTSPHAVEPPDGKQRPVETSTLAPDASFVAPDPPASTPAPTWPEGRSSRSQQNANDPAPFTFPEHEVVDEPAPQSSSPPVMSFEPTVEPDRGSADLPPTSTATSPPNPFSFDADVSRPISRSSQGAQPVVGEREVTVTTHDSFWSISEREYGSSRYFTALAQYNQDRVSRPEHLQSGMKILIPPPEVLEDRFPDLFQQSRQQTPAISPTDSSSSSTEPAGLFLDEQDRPRYRVGKEDTLSSIARQHLGRSSRWTEIYDLNKDRLKSPSTLMIGMELKLPPDVGRQRVSPAGGFDR